MNEPTPVHEGDALDWLHEQGKQRDRSVPEFDLEETLGVLRAARAADANARTNRGVLIAAQEAPSDARPQRILIAPGVMSTPDEVDYAVQWCRTTRRSRLPFTLEMDRHCPELASWARDGYQGMTWPKGRAVPTKEMIANFLERCLTPTPGRPPHDPDSTLVSSASDPAAGALRMNPIRVLIADGHALFRRGLEMVLEEEDDIDLVGQASDGAEAVAVAGEALPDVVLIEVRMPKISGIEACRAIREVAPSAKIVMLTISDEEEDLFEAIRAGASGYLLKDIPLDEVAEAVRVVHGGQSLINPSMAGKLLTEFATLAKSNAEAQHVTVPKLTEREMEVLKFVARGMNNRDIAKELFISQVTVKNHVMNILKKLQVHSRMEAVMIAVRQKLIEFS